MSETATSLTLNDLTGRTSRWHDLQQATWKVGELVDDQLVIDLNNAEDSDASESAAVALREMTLSADAVRQMDQLLGSKSRTRIAPRDLPSS